MNIAYLVFAYKNPQLIARQIKALSSPHASFFVHIDRKCDIAPFAKLAADNVILLDDRQTVYWAEFSGVSAILKLIAHAFDAPRRFDYFVLLSGSEFPLRGAAYIEQFFETHRGTEFIDLVPVPTPAAGRRLSHINTYRPPSTRPVHRFGARLLSRCGLGQRDYRKHFDGLMPYGGHTWWALSRAACSYILTFIPSHPRIVAFFQNSPQPEEFFFHTILGNSHFKTRVRRNVVFEDWSAGGSRPPLINESQIAAFETTPAVCVNDIWGSGEVLFARKFDDEHLQLVDRVEAMVRRKDSEYNSCEQTASA